VRVGFECTIDAPKTPGAGAVFAPKKNTFRVGKEVCKGYNLWLDPRSNATNGPTAYPRTPQQILANFVHELLHAALKLGGKIAHNGEPIFDKWHNPSGKALGGGDPGLSGEQYANSLAKKVDHPNKQRDGAGRADEH
jgi:hypothetical protein